MLDLPRAWRFARIALPLAFLPAFGCSCDEQIATLSASVEVDPAALDFGTAPLGSTKTLDLKLTNIGSFQLSIDGYATTLPFVAPTGTATVGTTQSITVQVGFQPTALGNAAGTLIITTNDPDAPTVEVPLSGVGIEAAVSVEPAAVDFGEVLVVPGGRTRDQVITISNPGTDSLDITAIALDPDGGGAYTLDLGTAVRTYAPGEDDTFTVTYRAANLGDAIGSILLNTTAPAAPEIRVPLTGKGVGPVLHICASNGVDPELCTQNGEQPRVDFLVNRDGAGNGAVRLLNTGDRDLTLSQVTVATADLMLPPEFSFSPSIDGSLNVVVSPGQETQFALSYLPMDYDFDSTIVSFLTDSATNDARSIRISGTVRQPVIQVTPDALTFSLSGASDRSQTAVAVFNCGTVELEIGRTLQIVQDRGPASAFSIENGISAGTQLAPQDCNATPAPAATFDVVFETSTAGTYSAHIDISSNDPTNPVARVQIDASKR